MTAKFRVHAFYVLIIAGLGVGISAGLSPEEIVSTLKSGFGNTLGAIGIVIIAGTCLGVILEKTGASISMAEFILNKIGKKNSSLSITITGLVFGIPIFCDAGFVVLSSLNKSLAVRSNTPMVVMAVSLGSSLLAIHCFIPPHPGATAAAGIVGVDIGLLMLIGIIIAFPTAMVGFAWANTFGKKYKMEEVSESTEIEINTNINSLPNSVLSFVPVLLPIILIGIKSISTLILGTLDKNFIQKVISLIGDPSIALIIGLALSFILIKKWDIAILNNWLGDGIKNAGTILAITAAGGAFGAILKETGIGVSIGETLTPFGLGIFLPFLIAAGLKTAQGSSTVAIITAASLVMPLLSQLQLDTGLGPILIVLSMGAGSMVASHANDSYFWVVTKFSNLSFDVSLKVFTTSTILMGISAQLIVYILFLVIM